MSIRTTVRNTIALAAFAVFASAPAAHAQVTLDFENLSNPIGGEIDQQGTSVTQKGFTVSAESLPGIALATVAPDAGTSGFNYTGSVALLEDYLGHTATLKQSNGGAFTLNSIDVANLVLQSTTAAGATVVFTGKLDGGGTVTQSFTHGLNDNLETVTFGSSFTNLKSVSFVQSFPFNQFDNIVVTSSGTAVPEPGSIGLLTGLSVAGAGFLCKRRAR